MEAFIEKLKLRCREAWARIVPYLRQILRFCALPYCYCCQIDWQQCTRTRRQVAGDLLYIFFRLGYYPDNYGICRFYEKDRADWRFYYGSSYNPFQRARLTARLQPTRYQVLFEDKEVCHQVCGGLGIAMPPLVGILTPDRTFAEFAGQRSLPDRLVLKPVTGAGGSGIFLADREGAGWRLAGVKGEPVTDLPRRRVRYVVEEFVEQHPDLAAVYPHSANTMRVMTLLGSDGMPREIGTSIRFGTGGNRADNWSLGGVAVALDLDTGRFGSLPQGKRGQPLERHPDTDYPFAEFQLPYHEAVRAFGERVQAAFPYFGMLGLDVAVTPDGPVLIEINAFPDLVGIEQGIGPLLRDPVNLREFSRLDLLTHSMRRALAADIARAEAG